MEVFSSFIFCTRNFDCIPPPQLLLSTLNILPHLISLSLSPSLKKKKSNQRKKPVRQKVPNKTHPENTENTQHLFMLASFCWAWSLHYSRVDIPSITSFERTDFPFSITCQPQFSCLLRVGLCVYFPFPCWGFVWVERCRTCVCCHSLHEFIYISVSSYLEVTVALESFITSGLTVCCLLLLHP